MGVVITMLWWLLMMMMMMNVVSMALQFDYPQLGSNSGGLFFTGDASANGKGIFLTQSLFGTNLTHSVGRVFYNNSVPFSASASFNTSFCIAINVSTASPHHFGDGVAFLIAGKKSPPPDNKAGGMLGLFSPNASRNSQIVAVEFDSFRNFEYDDPNNNHVGIDINSINSTATANLSSVGINLTSGHAQFSCWVEYDGVSKNLSVYASKEYMPRVTTRPPGTRLLLVHTVNLSTILPEEVYVGFSAATGNYTELHSILSWHFSIASSPGGNQSKTRISVGAKVGIGVSLGLLLFLVPLSIFYLARRTRTRRRWLKKASSKKSLEYRLGDIDLSDFAGVPRQFTYKELSSATGKFSQKNLLGRGGFGSVYKGTLHKSGSAPIAVKCIEKSSKQGEKEFLAEVTIISRIRHRNLLQLQGWCLSDAKGGNMLLVYDFMPNGSLDRYLFSSASSEKSLDWRSRYKIVSGLAAALVYLHEEWEKQVIHRDVKSSNVLLDQDMNARLGDFGLARLVDHDAALDTTRVAGTLGYLAPEVLETGKATSASDVYSFGAVALEVVCGRRSLDYGVEAKGEVRLADWVWALHAEGRMMEAVDQGLMSGGAAGTEAWEEGGEAEGEMVRVLKWGLACSHPDPLSRPTMRQVHESHVSCSSSPLIPPSKPLLGNVSPFPPSLTTSQVLCTNTTQPSSSSTLDTFQLSLPSSLST